MVISGSKFKKKNIFSSSHNGEIEVVFKQYTLRNKYYKKQ